MKLQIAVGGHGKSGRNPNAGLDHLAQAGILTPDLGKGIFIKVLEIDDIRHMTLPWDKFSLFPPPWGSRREQIGYEIVLDLWNEIGFQFRCWYHLKRL